MNYTDKLENTKKQYPFYLWSERFKHGLEQYTEKNVNSAKFIVDQLILNLAEIGELASEQEKVESFKVAVEALNDLNEEIDGCLIETEEREELCDLFDLIATVAGLDPAKYGDGDGIASEWRDW